MSTESEIVRVLRAANGKLDGRAICSRGAFHDLETLLKVLQRHSGPDGFIDREKPKNSATYVYGLRAGAQIPQETLDELGDEAPPPATSNAASPPVKPPKGDRSAARLHEHLFKTLEQLEAGEIDHVQAKARAAVADQIIKLANVQLLYAQLKKQDQLGTGIGDMPLIEDKG